MATSQQQPPLYNSQFSISPKSSFTIYLTTPQWSPPYNSQIYVILWVAVVERLHCNSSIRVKKQRTRLLIVFHENINNLPCRKYYKLPLYVLLTQPISYHTCKRGCCQTIDSSISLVDGCLLLYYLPSLLLLNPSALRKAKIVCNFGLSECNRVKTKFSVDSHFV